jgi:hypothetical protein
MEIKKLQNEEFIIAEKKNEDFGDFSENEINEKYMKGEIRIVTEQARYHLYTIPEMLASNKFNLNPEYQRRKRWSDNQKSKLIESFIINVPIPPIFLYEENFAEYEVMDGLQRLTAISDFYGNKFSLEGLEQWKELNGKRYDELPKKVQEGIDRRYLSSIILLNETAKTKEQSEYLKQFVFERLNSGGEKLVAQETRNALYSGIFNSLCLKLSENNNFRKMYKFPLVKRENEEITNEIELLKNEAYRKMSDVELVLRFFSYRHLDKMKSISQEVFLDEFLKQANKFPAKILQEYEIIFTETIDILHEIYGDKAFFMPSTIGQQKSTPTKTIFDPLMQVISNKLDKKEILLAKKEQIKEETFKDKTKLYIKDKSKNDELFDGKYNSPNNVLVRMKYFDDIIESIINQ